MTQLRHPTYTRISFAVLFYVRCTGDTRGPRGRRVLKKTLLRTMRGGRASI